MSSELQEIIHRTMHLAFEQGKLAERERIIKLLLDEVRYDFPPVIEMSVHNLIALIKGEQK